MKLIRSELSERDAQFDEIPEALGSPGNGCIQPGQRRAKLARFVGVDQKYFIISDH